MPPHEPHTIPDGIRLLNTKFHIPGPDTDTIVLRSALLAEMADAGARQLILVRAAAGFGKTTFLAQWIRTGRLEAGTAWVSLDARDNSPGKFWIYVMSALGRVLPRAARPAFCLVESGQKPGSEAVLITLMNGIEAAGRHCTLVLDDFHLITDPAILDGMNFIIDHPVPGFRLILSTRTTPDMGLSRLRAGDRLKEITETGLAFSRREIADFSSRISAVPVTGSALDTLARRTEGWVAGIKLALISGPGKPALAMDGLTGDAGFIRDYLMEEVWTGVPAPVQCILRRISILDRFNRELCHALYPESGTTDAIGFMRQNRLFLIPLDDQGNWFRFHHLFQDFLARQLEKTEDPKQFHLRASGWFRRHRYGEEAFYHAIRAGDTNLAARVLSGHVLALYEQGADDVLDPFLAQLPLSAVFSQPRLACYYAVTEVYNANFNVLDDLAACRDGKQHTREDRDLLEGFHSALTAYSRVYRTGALDRAVLGFEKARRLIPGDHGAMHRLLEFMVSFCHRYMGNIPLARRFARFRPDDTLLVSALSAMNRISLDLDMGNLKAAKEMAVSQVKAVASAFGNAVPAVYGFLFVYRGVVAKEENDLETADRYFAKGIAIVRETRFLELIIISYGEYAQFLCDAGRFGRAHDAIDQAIELSVDSPWIRSMMTAVKHQIWLREGKKALVADWADARSERPNMAVAFHESFECLTLVRYLLETREWHKASAILENLIRIDEKERRNGRLLICYLLRAKQRHLSGSNGEARVSFSKAVELSRNQGYVRCFLNELPGMEDLAGAAMAGDGFPSYLKSALAEVLDPASAPARQVVIHDFTEEFNTREIAILDLFRQGRSNREAAEALSLSVNTIRWYASRIFAKLSVKRRGQAVSRAMELGLI